MAGHSLVDAVERDTDTRSDTNPRSLISLHRFAGGWRIPVVAPLARRAGHVLRPSTLGAQQSRSTGSRSSGMVILWIKACGFDCSGFGAPGLGG